MTEDLFTAADVKKVRKLLHEEQQGKCALTLVDVKFEDTHLDHAHDEEQLVRGALHKQANMSLGKLESLAVRYLYWYPHDLPTFLRAAADYLEKNRDTRYRHPGWQRKLKVAFNKMSAKQMDEVLVSFGLNKGRNLVERKKLFATIIMRRDLGYNAIRDVMTRVKEQ